MRWRHLILEGLEKRLVLSGVGQPDIGQSGADWQSVIVALKDDVADPGAAASALVGSAGGHVGHVYQHALKGFSATLPAAALQGLLRNPMVESIEFNQVAQAYGWPSGTPYILPHGVDRIDADLSATQSNWSHVDVAIIDTGIDPNHPDLNVSPEGIHYYTRLTGPPNKRSGSDDNFADDAGHGSHVAGIVGAKNDNSYGVIGVAPGARLWGVKVLDSNGYGTVADIAAGVDWVVAHNANPENANKIEVINMSLGLQGQSQELRVAIQGAVAAGIVVVVAAGNNAQDVYGADGVFGTNDDFIPAAYPETITVSAMVDTDGIPGGLGPDSADGPDDSFAAFSNYSHSGAVDLVLPGVNLWSAWWDGSYVQLSGTSMAAPHAAALAAIHIAEAGLTDIPSGVTPLDVESVRQALIGKAIAQDDFGGLGLTTRNDPDGNLEPIGWAGPTDLTDYPPAANVTGPVAGALVAGVVALDAEVFNDDGAVGQVDFVAMNWADKSEMTIGPATYSESSCAWSVTWDTTGLNGLYRITAVVSEPIEGTTGTQSGKSAPIFITLDNGTVTNSPPIADAGGPYTVIPGGTVQLDASGTTDPDLPEDVLAYAWDFDNDGWFDDADGASPVFDATGLAAGADVTVALQVTDSQGNTDTDTAMIAVREAPAELIYDSASVPLAINDLKTVSSTITVPDVVTIQELTVRINLTHSNPADLTAVLISPNGASQFPLDSGGTTPVLSGDHEYSVAGASGMQLEGTWTLQIKDTVKNRLRGTFYDWSLIVEPAVTQATAFDAALFALSETNATKKNEADRFLDPVAADLALMMME